MPDQIRIKSIVARRTGWIGGCLLISLLLTTGVVGATPLSTTAGIAVNTSVDRDDGTSLKIQSVSLGINGQCKLGYWVPIRIRLSGPVPSTAELTVRMPDTDGILVDYNHANPKVEIDGGESVIFTIVKLGRGRGKITVLIRPDDDPQASPLVKRTFQVTETCDVIDSLRELYVAVGSPIEIASGSAIGSTGEVDQPASTILEDPQQLYSNWLAYESVDALMLETSRLASEPLKPKVQQAIKKWVSQGGRLGLIGGNDLKSVFANNRILASLFQVRMKAQRRMQSTSGLERAVKAETPVSDRRNRPVMATLESLAGEELIVDGDDPVVVRQDHGFGKVLLVTTNIALAPIADWAERKQFTGYLISQLNFRDKQGPRNESRISRYGYLDITGQLRVALDNFSAVSMVNFTVVAAIAILFIALIGPGDYFFLKKIVRRMELTWLTFLTIVALIGGLTVFIFYQAKPSRLMARQLEIIDLDPANGLARGTVWSHLYSPRSDNYKIDWQFEGASDIQPEQTVASWQGFAGDALGGMQNNSSVASASGKYRVRVDYGSDGDTSILQVPVNVAATKGLVMRWNGALQLSDTPRLKLVRGVLNGRVGNPLNVDLSNVIVMYQNSAFLFKPKLPPGDSFNVADDTVEKGIADYLNQRRLKEMGTEATPWIVTDPDLKRISEIMMFYGKAGGQGYVKLLQRYQNHVDFSNLMNRNVAMMIGRTKTPATRMIVNEKELGEEYEESWTYYRILIPVDTRTSLNR